MGFPPAASLPRQPTGFPLTAASLPIEMAFLPFGEEGRSKLRHHPFGCLQSGLGAELSVLGQKGLA